ncbi:MAG: hypothetical protein OSB74_09105 [Verrucomicrobiota bacterium]|nr:hypothetical protein [Verrucomicrobiota bacterium]
MIGRLGLVLMVGLSWTAGAGDIQPKDFGKGIINLLQFAPGKVPEVKPSPLTVVRDAKAYARFLERIPKKQISRTRPAPPNSDPLLKRPPIDFTKHTLLAVSRPAMTRAVFTKITSAKLEILVTVEFPREEIAARPIHIGTYTAVLIPKIKKPVRLRIVGAQR